MLLTLKILVAVSVLILIVGLIKPKWVLFFMKQPDRLTVTALAMVMFMGAWTGIAKLTLKPKSQMEEKPAVEDSNQLKLDR
jgi:ABC-type nickel/cobalt efflux system permease component RcnA